MKKSLIWILLLTVGGISMAFSFEKAPSQNGVQTIEQIAREQIMSRLKFDKKYGIYLNSGHRNTYDTIGFRLIIKPNGRPKLGTEPNSLIFNVPTGFFREFFYSARKVRIPKEMLTNGYAVIDLQFVLQMETLVGKRQDRNGHNSKEYTSSKFLNQNLPIPKDGYYFARGKLVYFRVLYVDGQPTRYRRGGYA
ncbi:MAG: hypothetical protein RR329_03980 [Mucinivorans sp.]